MFHPGANHGGMFPAQTGIVRGIQLRRTAAVGSFALTVLTRAPVGLKGTCRVHTARRINEICGPLLSAVKISRRVSRFRIWYSFRSHMHLPGYSCSVALEFRSRLHKSPGRPRYAELRTRGLPARRVTFWHSASAAAVATLAWTRCSWISTPLQARDHV